MKLIFLGSFHDTLNSAYKLNFHTGAASLLALTPHPSPHPPPSPSPQPMPSPDVWAGAAWCPPSPRGRRSSQHTSTPAAIATQGNGLTAASTVWPRPFFLAARFYIWQELRQKINLRITPPPLSPWEFAQIKRPLSIQALWPQLVVGRK